MKKGVEILKSIGRFFGYSLGLYVLLWIGTKFAGEGERIYVRAGFGNFRHGLSQRCYNFDCGELLTWGGFEVRLWLSVLFLTGVSGLAYLLKKKKGRNFLGYWFVALCFVIGLNLCDDGLHINHGCGLDYKLNCESSAGAASLYFGWVLQIYFALVLGFIFFKKIAMTLKTRKFFSGCVAVSCGFYLLHFIVWLVGMQGVTWYDFDGFFYPGWVCGIPCLAVVIKMVYDMRKDDTVDYGTKVLAFWSVAYFGFCVWLGSQITYCA